MEDFFLLHEKFKEVCLRNPSKTAVKSKTLPQNSSFTFFEIYDLSLKVASFLIQEKINKGERVAIILENCPQWPSIYFGILSAGGICVPLDPHLNPNEIQIFLKDSESKFIFISNTQANSYYPILKNLSFVEKVIVLGSEDGSKAFFSFEEITKLKPPEDKSLPAQIDDVASILYTSGTTALPKGVILTHKNFSANFNSIRKINLCSKGECFLSILPFYHAYAFMATLLFPLFLGAEIVFPLSLKAKDLSASMNEERVTILVGVPELFLNLHKAIFQEIMKLPFLMQVILNQLLSFNYWCRKITRINFGKIFFSKVHNQIGRNLRYMISGGARLEPKTAVDLFKLGFNVLEGYGLSETSPISCLNLPGRERFGSVGRPISNVEIQIINPDKDGVGEVAIRGENVFKGYYKRDEETKNAIKQGWFYSGDLGLIDKQRYLYLTGRSKEVIVLSSGKNIYPEEIEEYYKNTHVIKELCVLEVKDDNGITNLQAVVVPNFDYFKVAEGGNIHRKIKWEFENISHNLPSYKRITGFILTKDDLPRTTLGKIKRYEVKNRYLKKFSEKQELPEEKKEFSLEDLKILSSSLANRVIEFFKNTLSLKNKPNLDDHLELDLGVDSLAKVELIAGLEKLFHINIPDSIAQEITNVRQAILKLIDLLAGKSHGELKPAQAEPSWSELLLIEPSEEIKNKIELRTSLFNKGFTFILTKLLFAIFKLSCRFKVEGRQNIPKEGNFIFCANHASYLDGVVVASAMPFYTSVNLYFLGWKQIFEHPTLKWANKIARLVPIDSSAELMSTMQIASFILRNHKNICIFPEGQRTIDGEIKEFRKGIGILVKELGMPVIPLAIKGTFETWSRTRRFPKPHPINVIFGKPITQEDLLARIPKDVKTDYETISFYLRKEVEKLFLQDDQANFR